MDGDLATPSARRRGDHAHAYAPLADETREAQAHADALRREQSLESHLRETRAALVEAHEQLLARDEEFRRVTDALLHRLNDAEGFFTFVKRRMRKVRNRLRGS